MRKIIPCNQKWLYKDSFCEADICADASRENYQQIELPHTNIITPYSYFDEKIYQFISCYVKKLILPEEAKGKQIFLDFEGVMIAASVYCNGVKVGGHLGGYTPFSADITKHVKFGVENIIVVRVDSTEREDIPPFGNVVDYLTYGGIYREVSLRIVDAVYLEHAFIQSGNCLEAEKTLKIDAEIFADRETSALVCATLLDDGKAVGTGAVQRHLSVGRNTISLTLKELKGITLWEIENPRLYTVKVSFTTEEVQDELTERFGFREACFKAEGFYLNGKNIKLIGLNRHQSYPYVGYAMPERVQKKDADILKFDAGCNIVRTSHYPQSKHFLNRCDEIGLLVMEEIPGWQHIGDEQWQQQSIDNVEEMIIRDYNHPSIILWGVRINESQDNHDFYTRTNAVAHKLDTGRQTGGVRYIQRSEFLEDVYTCNDFSHCGEALVFRPQKETTGRKERVPFLVTESNGHMYPTKRFDHESRLVEHTKRHLRIIGEAIGRDDICGSISWCAFDYNTHGNFGSGDKICYHGVYDMFRNPKYAAWAYASQKDPHKGIVLEAASLGCRGEKDGGGIVPFVVLTNCDYVKAFKNGKVIGKFYPDKEDYPNLQHPPITVSHVMEEEFDIGLPMEDVDRFRNYVTRKVKNNELMSMKEEDMEFLQEIAAKSDRSLKDLISILIKGAGGWGDSENTIILEGYMEGEKAAEKTIGEHKSMAELSLTADDKILNSGMDTYDATRITVEARDTLGNLMPFTQECVTVTIEGALDVMGPSQFSLMGGCASFWVCTKGKSGKAVVAVKGMYYKKSIGIDIM